MHSHYWLLCRYMGFKLQSSCLQSKGIYPPVIFPAPRFQFQISLLSSLAEYTLLLSLSALSGISKSALHV